MDILRKILLPLSGPALVALIVVNATWVWNDLLVALVLLPNDRLRTLVVGGTGGHRFVTLENDLLRVSVLPEKGADIYELVDLASGVDVLMKTPWGLRPPGDRPPTDFLENYEGCWQELFPSVNDACQVRGAEIPFHGEVALLAWETHIEDDAGGAAAALFCVRSGGTGLRPRAPQALLP